jgi:methylphosphotriester-DNA--protein-cysteine methyltransferase
MLDPQTRQQLQTKFQQVKPQLKQRFSGVTDQDLDVGRSDPDALITTISQKTGQPAARVEAEIRSLVGSA